MLMLLELLQPFLRGLLVTPAATACSCLLLGVSSTGGSLVTQKTDSSPPRCRSRSAAVAAASLHVRGAAAAAATAKGNTN